MIENFYALVNGKAPLASYDTKTKELSYRDANIHVFHMGDLHVPSGIMGASDPYVELGDDTLVFDVPKGSYPAYITIADVSPQQDGSHYREAYLSIKFSDNETTSWEKALPIGIDDLEEDDTTFYGVGVDAGMVGFYDASAASKIVESLENDDDLFDLLEEELQQDGTATYGILNLEDPETNGNVVYSHSGWGDGFYPVIATRDKDGNLTGYHIDLGVVGKE